MNDAAKTLLEILRTRKSVRGYLDMPVPADALEMILQAGRWAPSAFNLQPWDFIVVQSGAAKDTLLTAIAADVAASAGNIAGYTGKVAPYLSKTPLFIAVVGSPGMKEAVKPNRIGLSADKLYATSVSLPVGNMLLMVSALGLGSVCFTPSSEEWSQVSYRRALHLPADKELYYLLPVGYPEDAPAAHDEGRRKPLDELVHWDAY